jgi:hypothetical protein
MKNHPEAETAIKSHNLHLFENEEAVWTGGLTTLVTYSAKDRSGNVLAKSSFEWNRHPGCYRGQALRRGSARCAIWR